MSATIQDLEIDRWSAADRLRLIGEIWDSLSPGEQGIALTSEELLMSELDQPDNLKPLQGNWRVTSCTYPHGDNRLQEIAWLNEEGIALVIEGSRITHNGETVATLADNPYSVFKHEEAMGTKNGNPLVLTLPDGKRLLCSLRLYEDSQTFRLIYPHTGCTRSGHVVRLARVSK